MSLHPPRLTAAAGACLRRRYSVHTVTRLIRALPVPIVRGLPPIGWWLLKRLPRRWSEWFLLWLIGDAYRELSHPEAVIDDALLDALIDPQVEWAQPPTLPDAQEYRGHAGVRENISAFLAIWSEVRMDVRAVALDPRRETVLVKVEHYERGRLSGVETRHVEFHLYRVQQGRVWRLEMFTDEKAAQEARYRQAA
jgi:ketosteroid isomerase-like protein